MPRYRISTFNGSEVIYGGGIDLPDLEAVENLLRLTLTTMMRLEGSATDANNFWADALDDNGERVIAARISLSVTRL
ncbi:hypothetical protein Q8W71_30990 [Methylobacterium sp. NEAU 140]|uniref:DUF6894 family protein n=1 Tax=Methylobacterium sp. NEAU 140 TaxID=3064945 RepID=UPI0027368928|nr:hypothetical protein [Methylobacterium sp. NEAU 140]MDP4027019.1 hypothetical protein [Methylobacterium sp. NEAU 140]